MSDRRTSKTLARPMVLLVGFEDAQAQALREVAAADYQLMVVRDREEVFPLLSSGSVAVLCLGDGLAGEKSVRLLTETAGQLPQIPTLNVVLAAGSDATLFNDLIGDNRIYYLSRHPPSPPELQALLSSAVQRYQSRLDAGHELLQEGRETAQAQRLVETLRRLAMQSDPCDSAELLAQAARQRVAADRAYCLLYDSSDEVLWAGDPGMAGERRESAAVGLASFVLRSGLPVLLARADRDARYDRDIDDPAGEGGERFLAVPIHLFNGRVIATLSAVRDAAGEEFSPQDRRALESLATQAAPYFVPHSLKSRPKGEARKISTVFRPEALEHHARSSEARFGDPLRMSPAWARWSYWALLAALLVGFFFSLVVEVHEYATGLAVVRLGGQTHLTARTAGIVSASEVEPGQKVEAGQVLVRFHEEQEAAALRHIEREFELQLINRLRDPSDRSAEQALISLRAQRELALAHLEERYLRAPAAGIVSDLRVKPGQYLAPGQLVLSIVHETVEPSILVMLPGEYRPLLKAGMPLRLEMSGYRYAYQHLAVDSVGDRVVSPAEALRYLGPGAGDAVSVPGPVVIVEARLPSPVFQIQGRSYRYHDGMQGIAEVRIRSEKILLVLIPALKTLTRDHDA